MTKLLNETKANRLLRKVRRYAMHALDNWSTLEAEGSLGFRGIPAHEMADIWAKLVAALDRVIALENRLQP